MSLCADTTHPSSSALSSVLQNGNYRNCSMTNLISWREKERERKGNENNRMFFSFIWFTMINLELIWTDILFFGFNWGWSVCVCVCVLIHSNRFWAWQLWIDLIQSKQQQQQHMTRAIKIGNLLLLLLWWWKIQNTKKFHSNTHTQIKSYLLF